MKSLTVKSVDALRERLDQNLAMQIMAEYLVAMAPIGNTLKIIDKKPPLPISEQCRALRAFMFRGIRK